MQSQQDGETNNFYSSGGVSTLEKAAQGGSGFQTYGLDLGVIGSRQNTDDEMNRQAASRGGLQQGSQSYQGSSSSSSSYGSGTQSSGSSRSSTSQHSSHHSSHGSHDSQYDEDDYETVEEYDQQEEDEQQNQNSKSSSQQQRTSNYNYVSSSNPSRTYSYSESSSKFQHYPQKRDTSSKHFENPCPNMNCMRLRCVVGPLEKTSALVAFRTRVVAETLHKVSQLYSLVIFKFSSTNSIYNFFQKQIGGEKEVKLSTLAVGQITRLPYFADTSENVKRTHEVTFTAIPDPIPKPDIVPLWIVVLAAIVGMLILILLVYLLYKV
jgi:hypothetical protein